MIVNEIQNNFNNNFNTSNNATRQITLKNSRINYNNINNMNTNSMNKNINSKQYLSHHFTNTNGRQIQNIPNKLIEKNKHKYLFKKALINTKF